MKKATILWDVIEIILTKEEIKKISDADYNDLEIEYDCFLNKISRKLKRKNK